MVVVAVVGVVVVVAERVEIKVGIDSCKKIQDNILKSYEHCRRSLLVGEVEEALALRVRVGRIWFRK